MAIDYISYRKEICGKCEFKKQINETLGAMCVKCGCSLTFKIPIPFTSCPERKWEAMETLNNGL